LIGQLNAPSPHRIGNVLEVLWPEVVTCDVDLAPDLPIGVIRNANPAVFGNTLKAGSNVDAIAENVVVIENDVTNVNADAKFDPLILRHGGILLGHAALDFNRTAHRIDGAGKLDQHTVAGRLNDPASMGGYSRVN
jgi:hypothetical protein